MGNCFDNNRYSISSSLKLVEKKIVRDAGQIQRKRKRDIEWRIQQDGLEKFTFFYASGKNMEQVCDEKPVLQRTPEFNTDFLGSNEQNQDEDKMKGESTEESPSQNCLLGIQSQGLPNFNLSDNLNCVEEQKDDLKNGYSRNSECSNNSEETEYLKIIKKQISNQFDLQMIVKESKGINLEKLMKENFSENHFENNVVGCELCKQSRCQKIIIHVRNVNKELSDNFQDLNEQPKLTDEKQL